MALIDSTKQNAEEEALIEKIDCLISKLKQTCSNEDEKLLLDQLENALYSGTLVKTKIDKFLNVSGSRHCSIEQQCREVALCWRDVPDG